MYNVIMHKRFIFNKGRDALREIIRIYSIKEIYLPYYLCDVVRHTVVKEQCKPIFYHIDDKFFPAESFEKDNYILYPNYWGICRKNVKKLVDTYPKLIVDNAHAYFDEPCGFACFNAGHKFGYKYSYLWLKESGEKDFSNYLHNSNIKRDIAIRKEVFLKLNEKYKNDNLLNIDTESTPFVYPFLARTIDEADNLVKELKREGKTIYRYWNPLPKSYLEYKFYSKLVPIPIAN